MINDANVQRTSYVLELLGTNTISFVANAQHCLTIAKCYHYQHLGYQKIQPIQHKLNRPFINARVTARSAFLPLHSCVLLML